MGKAKPPYSAAWMSTIPLVPNTRIAPYHLRKSQAPTPAAAWTLPDVKLLEGKYVKRTIPANCEVNVDNLSSSPDIAFVKDYKLLIYESNKLRPFSILVNAGALVTVCDSNDKCPNGPFRIAAIVSDLILVEVPSVEADSVRKTANPQLRLEALPETQFQGDKSCQTSPGAR
jgi:hypothetical protein